MKRIFTFILMLCITLSVCGCQTRRYNIIPFENKNAELECAVNNKFDVTVKKEDNTLSLTVRKPKEIEGTAFVFSETESYAISGETKIPIDKSAYSGIYAIVSILNIKEEMSLSASRVEGGSSVMFSNADATYLFNYDSNGYLVSVKIESPDFVYDVTVKAIKIQQMR